MKSTSAREIGRAIIDQLGPNDMAAVVYTFVGRLQNFTTDRSELLAAVDSFTPRNSGSAGVPLGCVLWGCVTETLTNVATVLNSAPAGRKLIAFIGSSFDIFDFVEDDAYMAAAAPNTLTPHLEAIRALQAANVSVNVFDPAGLTTTAARAEHGGGGGGSLSPSALMRVLSGMRALADATGGRAVLNTNRPERHVARVFDEHRSYYLLGIRPAEPADGRYRRLQVTVTRPGVTVRTRAGYFVADRWGNRGGDTPGRTPLDEALASGLFRDALPIEMNVLTLAAAPDLRQSSVWVTARFAEGVTPSPLAVDVFAAVFDTQWRERGHVRQRVERSTDFGESGRTREVYVRFDLPPGRYELRLAAESGGRTGSVLANIDVPDVSRDELSASRVVFGYDQGEDATGPATADEPPVRATIDREFGRDDRVVAWSRVYQGTRRAATDVTLTTRVIAADGRHVAERRRELAAEQFGGRRYADVRYELPLAELAPGDYVLAMDVTTARQTAERQVRFAVR